MAENIKNNSKERVLVISACPADLQLCLGVIKNQSPGIKVLMLITWANSTVRDSLIALFRQHEELPVTLSFLLGADAYEVALEERWVSIYLFTMGTDWLGKILYKRKDVLRYRDCYMDYDLLEVREISWDHISIIKFHGLKYWLKLQALRLLTFVKCYRYKLELRPDMHIWPRTEDIKSVWEELPLEKGSFKLAKLPDNAVIFCFSSTDNGWMPDWDVLKSISNRFFYKRHPRTGGVDYLSYPDWVQPLDGYDLPMELYECPNSSLLVGITSTALGSSLNSMSLWQIKLSDWEAKERNHSADSILFKASSMNSLNCRNDLYHLYRAYAARATYVPKNNLELVRNASPHFKITL